MELTQEDKQVIVNILQQVSLPVNQAPAVLKIIDKLKFEITEKLKQPTKQEAEEVS